ncbi:hypothetical protein K1T71_001381 [Dendrolimus kikuchii]|uniref:Uncharacterized protein n=1 Tax=Dendrolimus kikuchii TaxID=765133 RepID=A0ACC1DHM5_9NEOP|nr:hypothetical protein K1T71_001381 [Dendrolimus kikuchii]
MIYLYVAALFLVVNSANGLQTVNGRIKITTGTTSGCSDTVTFINNQLVEAYRLYGNFIDLEFVPWGRTVRGENSQMTCQFGVNDCWANRLHRCVLDMLKDDQATQLDYLSCEFSPPYPSFILGTYQCVVNRGLSLVEVDTCVANMGDELDWAAQAAAEEPMRIINFVPSIHFNDVIDIDLHNEARQRLSSMICFALADDPNSGITSCSI